MKYETTKELVDLTANVSHDPDEADWSEVHEYLENVANSAPVLKDLLHFLHEEYL